ncbi:MAG: PAS domain S-box protein [Magnetococcales bacterium]|nr:PAS domain S-box protein [Magnetococcales bacterium]
MQNKPRKRIPLLSILALLGLLGNWMAFPLPFGLEIGIGNAAALIAVRILGIPYALFILLCAALPGWITIGHPHALPVYLIEIIVVGFLVRRSYKNILLVDAVFWLIFGLPGYWLCVTYLMPLYTLPPELLIGLQAVKSVVNALLASLVCTLIPFSQLARKWTQIHHVNLRLMLTNLLAFFVIVPALVTVVFDAHDIRKHAESQVVEQMAHISIHWKENHPHDSDTLDQYDTHSYKWLKHLATHPGLMGIEFDSEGDIVQRCFRIPHGNRGNPDWWNGERIPIRDGVELRFGPDSIPIMDRWNQASYFMETTAFNRRLVLMLPTNELIKNYQYLLGETLTNTLFILVLAIFLASLISQHMTSSLFKLAEITAQLPQRILTEKPLSFASSPIEEVSHLSNHLQTVATLLQQNFLELDLKNSRLHVEMKRRDQTQEALHASEARFRSLVETSPDVIQLVDRHGVIRFINCDRFDMEPPLMQGICFLDHLDQSGQVRFWKAMDTIFEQNHVDIFDIRSVGGVWWHVRIVPLPWDDQSAAMMVLTDTTGQHTAEASLRKSEQKYRELVENLNDGLVIVDRNRTITYCNHRITELMQCNRDDLLGRAVIDLVPEHERHRIESQWRSRMAGDARPYEIEGLNSSGDSINLMISPRAIYDSDNNFNGSFAVITDMTQRKRAEEALVKSSDRLRELTRHIQTVREEEQKRISRELHDELGSFLTKFKLDLSFMHKQMINNQKQANKIEDLLVLTDEAILTMRRIVTSLRPKVLDQFGLLAGLEWLAREFNRVMRIPCIIKPGSPNIRMDERRETVLFRIAQEALTNITRHANAESVSVALLLEKQRIVLTIKDDGKGFAPEIMLNTNSFGIRGMVERARQYGGDVTVRSAIGKGAQIIAWLPRQESDRVETL